jgi:hypothetical protein
MMWMSNTKSGIVKRNGVSGDPIQALMDETYPRASG